ncbi:hypothetical protein [Mucilaginibacter ginkgonis]|nr:hypothetical protein [Mucilaginibacter ginkgonis]
MRPLVFNHSAPNVRQIVTGPKIVTSDDFTKHTYTTFNTVVV